MMADKPILFSGPMVRALLAGTKTQTRREFSTDPCLEAVDRTDTNGWRFTFNPGGNLDLKPPRIAVGDRLYVREAWAPAQHGGYDGRDDGGEVWYRATDEGQVEGPWKPSLHMPRWASRITLTVTDVRVERLQDISEADAVAEGCIPDNQSLNPNHIGPARDLYAALWDSINGPDAWDVNPWVAAYTFTVEQGNIDALASAA